MTLPLRISILLLVMAASIVYSCKKEEDYKPIRHQGRCEGYDYPIDENCNRIWPITVRGHIYNSDGTPCSGALLQTGQNERSTDSTGFVQLMHIIGHRPNTYWPDDISFEVKYLNFDIQRNDPIVSDSYVVDFDTIFLYDVDPFLEDDK